MDRYKKYMDGAEPSGDLRSRLTELTAPKRKPYWKRYGALAAALVLAIGVGAFGLSRWGGMAELGALESMESFPAIDEIAVEPGAPLAPSQGTQTAGGYEVADGEAVSYYMLPLLRYSEVTGGSAASLAVPMGVERRELEHEEILNLLGGEAALVTHLDWGGFDVHGYVMAYEDGSVWRAHLFGKAEDGYFDLIMCPDAVPLDCCVAVAEDRDNVTEVWGVEVSGCYGGIYGEGADREVWFPESREVSFLSNGVGCRFTFYGPEGEGEMVEEKVSRFVRLAVLDGLELDALVPGWEPEPMEETDGGASPSEAPEEEISTPAYDPNA